MTSNPEPSEARTPAHGLRVSADDENFIVRALDSSGRGRPLKALVVPVEQQGDRFRLVEPEDALGSRIYDAEWPEIAPELCQMKRELSKKKPVPEEMVTLYSIKVKKSEWPLSSSSVLVFLLYDQSEGVGGNPRPPRSTGDNSIATLVKEALEHDSADALRGGLIRCRPGGCEPGKAIPDAPQRVTFALASCQYPSDMFNRMPRADRSTSHSWRSATG
jgi:hypothetical protein